jgi:hypothetical protein
MEAVPARKLNPIAPQVRDGRHVLAWDDLSFEVDARTGGRVTALRVGGRNLLTGPEIDAGNFGSTFWTSARSASLGVEIEKRFSADRARGAVLFEYRIHNLGTVPLRTAPWQITRVGPGGLTFYPSGDGAFPPSNLGVQDALGATWYDYDRASITEHQKHFADGREGWLAHVDGDALLIKTFPAVPRAAHAPGEAQIEIYASPAHTYVEVEAQGAYEIVDPGEALTWEVVWLARRLPPKLSVSVGSQALLAHVRALVAADMAAR